MGNYQIWTDPPPLQANVEELSLPSWSRKPRLGHDDDS